ncbi:hypothetical protein [Pseudogulbenkiania ferrooxidans]|uniref:Uncharacterized protein n=1 Tax=Pseudogulbenkiania ferrooxidans 2002 TaxID=279714 RepID=B9Z0V2_9NEIS|nr:hypothetical protein [Pseudogulbenkiania ferrooxidans]EEG09708.1 hypothetical protein FuraDRAFT_0724 [Pseudogulbenkiania ferrooxidans 2002]
MRFSQVDWLPHEIEAVYQVVANEWQSRKELQIYLDHLQLPAGQGDRQSS